MNPTHQIIIFLIETLILLAIIIYYVQNSDGGQDLMTDEEYVELKK